VETVFRSFDPKSRTCMAMPEIASGDFVINWSRKDQLKLKLIACRRILNHVDSSRVLAEVLNASGEWGQRCFYLAPEEPETLVAALQRAVGKEGASQWLTRFFQAIAAKRVRVRDTQYLEALGSLMVK